MPLVDLSIIIINYNSADYVSACLRIIRDQTSGVEYEEIVVDNASFDGCRERLAHDFPDVLFIQSQSNLGFGRANNLGAKHAKGKVLLFLNPDTEVQDCAIDRLYEQLWKLNNPGAVGCRLLNSDGSLQTSSVQALPTLLNQVLDAKALQRLFPKSGLWGTAVLFGGGTEPTEVEVVSGACLMIRKNVFERVGGFSPEYFMYGEDLDLCFKARRAGFQNYHVGSAVIVHHGGGSTNRSVNNFSNVMMCESVYRLLRKTRGRIYSNCYRASMCVAAVIRLTLLGALFPVWYDRGNGRGWNAVIRKWFRILRWGLGLERWIRKYDQAETATTGSGDGKSTNKNCTWQDPQS
jgi:GT2 family glycosyltransferase